MKPAAKTAILHSPDFALHLTGVGHPETPRRVTRVIEVLKASSFVDRLDLLSPRVATQSELARVHSKAYLATAKADVESGASDLSTGDTQISADSWRVATLAAGAGMEAVDRVVAGTARNAFCVVRPPGHHATPVRGMGFCLFNNIALAARHAQQKHGIGKVLIADWDVHHGNGTQDVFYEDGSVLFFDTHQHPLYPGTGDATEQGSGKGLGLIMNNPFPSGSGKEIVAAFRNRLVDAANRFKPDLVLVSAGFDSRMGDPLGGFKLTDEDFAELTRIVMAIAASHCGGRLVSLLEGGYNIEGLALAASEHVRVLSGDIP